MKNYYTLSLLVFSSFLTDCSHYWTPDPMRPTHLATVVDSDATLCLSVKHSRHASKLVRHTLKQVITDSPPYRQAHHLPPVIPHHAHNEGRVEKDAFCPLSPVFRHEKWKIVYILKKVAHEPRPGWVSYSYKENVDISAAIFDKYGYNQEPARPHKKSMPAPPVIKRPTPIDLWIQRHLSYPQAASSAGIEGYTTVRVWIMPQGKVRSVRFIKSSGNILLDNATMNMFTGERLPVNRHGKMVNHIDFTVHYAASSQNKYF